MTRAVTVLFVATALAGLGCDDPVQVGPPGVGPGGGASGPVAPRPAQQAPADAGPPDAGGGALASLRDEDFVEAESNRDPFRNYSSMFQRRPVDTPQRTVKMPTTSIEQMRLIAIISGVARPRAMLVDQMGVGHVVERGDYLGRAEVVQTGGAEGMPVTLNWRVDRIRPNEVVLSRDDPTQEGPALTRMIPLHEDEDSIDAPGRR